MSALPARSPSPGARALPFAGLPSRLARSLLCLLLAPALAGSPAAAAMGTATGPVRASLPTIERQVMCVTCKIPLNVAESPQANRERALIRRLIAQGRDETQIKRVLVAEYGEAVLALPSAKGFDLAVYLVPAVVVLALAALLAVLLPSWRRRAREQRELGGPPPPLSASDAARLQADLDRFD